MNITVEAWDKSDKANQAILSLVCDAFPLAFVPKPDESLQFLTDLTTGLEDSFFVAKENHQLVGFALLSRGRDSETASMSGCVSRLYRRRGTGKRLLQELMQTIRTHPSIRRLTTSTYASDQSGQDFLQNAGFTEVDRVFWSQCPVDHEFPAWCLAKEQHVGIRELKFLTGSEYKRTVDEWARKLWQLDTESACDIPSTVGFEPTAFEEWLKFTESEFVNFGQALVAVCDHLPVGVLKLGAVENEKMNINYTGVARSHRRIGLSTVLKMKAFEHARRHGAQWVTTQNHQNNPIYSLNLSMGFRTIETIIEFSKSLDVHSSATQRS